MKMLRNELSWMLFVPFILLSIGGCAYSKLSMEANLAVENRFYEIIDHYETNPEIFESVENEKLQFLCQAYSELNDFANLQKCLNKMQENYDNGDRYVMKYSGILEEEAISKINQLKAETYLKQGRYNEALSYYKQIDEFIVTKWGKYEGFSMYGPAICYAKLGELNKARLYTDKYIQVLNKTLENLKNDIGDNTKYLNATIYTNNISLATIYMALNDFEKVYDLLISTPRPYREFKKHMVYEYFMIGKSAIEIGSYKVAKTYYLKIEKLLNQTRSFGQVSQIMNYDLGRIYYQEGKTNEAIEYLEKSINMIESHRSKVNTDIGKIGFVGDKQDVYSFIINVLVEKNEMIKAFEYVERSKSRALVDLLSTKNKFAIPEMTEDETKNLLSEIDSAEMRSLGSPHQVNDTTNQEHIRSAMISRKNYLTEQHSQIGSLISVNTLDLKTIQKYLPEDETLIEYYYHENDIFIFVVTKDSFFFKRSESSDLSEKVIMLKNLIVNSSDELRGIKVSYKTKVDASFNNNDFNDYQKISRHFYDFLIRPIENHLGTQNLTIIPHGSLHYLPFSALMNGKKFLIDNYQIRILPAASTIKAFEEININPHADLIAFGNPNLENPDMNLPFAQREVIEIKKLLPNSKILIGAEANETAVKNYAKNFKYVHLACHGEYNPEQPLKSGLYLSKDDANDGYLTVDELFQISLQAELVTLSACETGLGKTAKGDDIIGFTRGFLYAGTRSIISSLWKVDDKATLHLMKELYKNLANHDKRTALRLSQLNIKENYNSHPFYWAAFQIIGEHKNMK